MLPAGIVWHSANYWVVVGRDGFTNGHILTSIDGYDWRDKGYMGPGFYTINNIPLEN